MTSSTADDQQVEKRPGTSRRSFLVAAAARAAGGCRSGGGHGACRGGATPDVTSGIGAKGGLLTGIVARGIELRRDDGTVATAVLLVRRTSRQDTARITGSTQALNDALVAAVEDPDVRSTLRCF